MKTLKLEIEVEYDPDIMHGEDVDALKWFYEDVLLNPTKGSELFLWSNKIGDSIGICKVNRILES